mmetsp:Transcript_11880/g.22013  ORF Transcript_11880/g.22013 Transcript_11880/m.22013 type:complete len:722 (+) Transcript_11880:277-2442(+)
MDSTPPAPPPSPSSGYQTGGGQSSSATTAERQWDLVSREDAYLPSSNLVTEQEVAMLYSEQSPLIWSRGAIKDKLVHSCSLAAVKRKLPFLEWAPKYSVRNNLRQDMLAGLTVGIILIPQGISYGLLAGLPPQYGLYTCLVPPVIYSLLGTCIQLQIGPFALISLLISNTVSEVVDPDDEPERYVQAVLTLSVMVGILLFVMSVLRLGFVVNFLASPVTSGLTCGGAMLIVTSQLGSFVGLSLPRGTFFNTWALAFQQIASINVPAIIIGLCSLAILMLFRVIKESPFGIRYNLKLQPVQLYVMILGTVVSYALDLHARFGLRVLGDIPSGLPQPGVPGAFDLVGQLVTPTIVIVAVGYSMSMATSKTFASKGGYEVSSNQELLALGIANMCGSFFGGHPAFVSLSRTAIVFECGAKSSVHNFFSAGVVILVLLFLTEYLFHLPYTCLAAIIFDSLRSLLLQIFQPRILWKQDRRDMVMWLLTFTAVIVFGITVGLVCGVVFSVVIVIYAVANPNFASVGRFEKLPWLFKDISRFPDAQQVPSVLIFRYDSVLNFVNANHFRVSIQRAVATRKTECKTEEDELHTVVLDASSITDCDTTAMSALKKVYATLNREGIELILCNCRGHFRSIIRKSEISFQEYVALQDAVVYAEGKRLHRHSVIRLRTRSNKNQPNTVSADELAAAMLDVEQQSLRQLRKRTTSADDNDDLAHRSSPTSVDNT